jgi:hypothetical protein
MKQLTCREIAARIDAHLKRFEADPKINTLRDEIAATYCDSSVDGNNRNVRIRYRNTSSRMYSISKSQALAYLAWLDAGNVGKHWGMK